MWKKWVIPAIVALVGPWMLLVGIAMADSPCNRDLTCQRGLLCVENACRATDYMSFDYTPIMNAKAEEFLKEIKARQLNVVTAESLTSGSSQPLSTFPSIRYLLLCSCPEGLGTQEISLLHLRRIFHL